MVRNVVKEEIMGAIMKIKNDKVVGMDGIYVEMLKMKALA